MDGKNYTVMELAEQVGVPRTTINDWLGRYSQYIDTVAQGKRKVYPENALNVLREIAAMRNAGKAFTEIETELSAKHPIRAVPVTPQDEKPAAETAPGSGTEKPSPGSGSANKTEDNFAIQPREHAEEIGRLIGDSFRNMDQRIRELEKLSRAQRRMSFFWLGTSLLFLIFLAGGSFLAWHFHRNAKKENLRLQHRQQETAGKLAAMKEQSAALKEQSVALIAGNKAFKANIVRLESELKQQKKEFEQNIRTEKERLTELHRAQEKALLSERDQARLQAKERETNLALEKEKFAAERLKLLAEMEKLKEQQKSLAQENQKLKESAQAASQKPAAEVEKAAPKQEPPAETKPAAEKGEPASVSPSAQPQQ